MYMVDFWVPPFPHLWKRKPVRENVLFGSAWSCSLANCNCLILPDKWSLPSNTGSSPAPPIALDPHIVQLVAAYIYYCTARYSIMALELNCVKIPQGEANKSANRCGNLRAKSAE
jgi:hypothetical protein